MDDSRIGTGVGAALHRARHQARARRNGCLGIGLLALAGGALPALAQDSSGEDGLDEVVILGRGETRQLQGVAAEQIAYLPAGTSPLKAIEKLPGVNFQSADPFGAYEWSTRIVVRGFNQNQLGFTLDGVPLGDMSYGNHNGLHISRAVPPENTDRVLLSQGAGSLSTASSSNLGGTLEFFSLDPSREFDGSLELTGGSDSTRRLFGRLDSGSLGSLGTRFSLSAVDGTTEKWKGAGDQDQRMYNFKVVQPFGDEGAGRVGKLTGYYNYSDRAEVDYQDLSFDIIRRRGSDWDNFFPDWNAAVQAARSCAAGGFAVPVCDDAYWNASGLREDRLGYLALDLPAGEAVDLRLTAYNHRNEGQGLWGTPYVPTPMGAPLSVRTTEYDIDRSGAIAGVTWRIGAHEVNAGAWVESNDFNQARRFYPEPNVAAPSQNFTRFLRNPLQTQWEYAFETETVQLHLQDTWQVSDALRLAFGFKALSVENTGRTITGPNLNGTIEVDEGFLPQAGFNWTLSDSNEVFGQVARNARAFVSAATSGPFSTTAAGFAAIRDTLEPETSTTVELGWRFRGDGFEGSLAAYAVDFEDRLLAIQQGAGIIGNPSVLANVGSVSTRGVEAALVWRPASNLAWFNSLAWNDSQYDDDFFSNGVRVPVSGRQVVDTPEILFKSVLTYDTGSFFARLDASYVDERFYTFLNQGGVEAYEMFNASVGYRFTDVGVFEELSLQGAVTNIADEDYIATIGSNGFVNADPNGTSQTLLRGAPRQFFVTLKARF
ncbi:MAG: TonB-dependent receptor [Steroidobacteraceae bacterium]|jgi:iron complex outermembrane receptor protein|nr:TonB-dependent receptor [Steroidobacteraceae bacterium]